jgi:cell division protein FtsL
VFPLALVSSTLSFILLLLYPGFFMAQHFHWLLGAVQIAVAIIGLMHNTRALIAWQEPVVQREMEELAVEE